MNKFIVLNWGGKEIETIKVFGSRQAARDYAQKMLTRGQSFRVGRIVDHSRLIARRPA